MTTEGSSARARPAITSWRRETRAGGRPFTTTAFGVAMTCATPMAVHAQTAQTAQTAAQTTQTTQTQQTVPKKATAADGTVILDTINVTGAAGETGTKIDRSADSRFTADLVDTPKTVTVIPAEVIEERDATTLQDLFRTTPGITMQSGEGGQPNADRPMIRGSNAETNVLTDGLRDSGAQTRGTFNLEQVEVVKGADSTFSGRGGAGGTINLVTKLPKARDFTESTLTYGSDNTYGAAVDTNMVLSDSVAARLNLYLRDGGVAGRDAVENRARGVAAAVSMGMNSDFRVHLAFSHYETDGLPDYGIPWNGTEIADTDYDNFYGLTDRDFQNSTDDSVTLKLEKDLAGGLLLTNTTRFTRSTLDYVVTNPDDSRGNVANGYVWRGVKSRGSDSESYVNQTELSGEATTGRISHSFALGLEVSHEDNRNQGYTVDTGSSSCGPAYVGESSGYNCTTLDDPNPDDPWAGTIARSGSVTKGTADTVSLYAFDTLGLAPKWDLNLGLRYDRFYVTRESSSYDGSQTSEFLNYQLGVVYKPAPNGSIYISYATAASPVGVANGEGGDDLSSSSEDLEPEHSYSLELGTKWNVLNDRLALTAAVFQNRTENARVAAGRGQPQENVGEQRVRGFELGAAGNITERWSVSGGYTYLDSKITADADGSTVGKRFPNTPKHSLGLWSTYRATPRLKLGLGATYRSEWYADTGNTKTLPDYWRFDGSVEYRLSERASLLVVGNNLTDARYFDRAHSAHFAVPAPGRSVVASVKMSF